MALLFIPFFFLMAFLIWHFYWKKHITFELNKRVSLWLKWTHYIGCILCIIGIWLNIERQLVFKLEWLRIFVVFTTAIIGIFLIVVVNKKTINRIERIYFYVFSFFPAAVALLTLVPFIGIVIVFSAFGFLSPLTGKVRYDDEHLRIQGAFTGVLAGPHTVIIEKGCLFDKYTHVFEVGTFDVKSVKVEYGKDSTRIYFYNPDIGKDSTAYFNYVAINPWKK